MEREPMFFRQMTDAFLVRTDPASSIVNPAHIHITSPPQTRKEKVSMMKRTSLSTNCNPFVQEMRADCAGFPSDS